MHELALSEVLDFFRWFCSFPPTFRFDGLERKCKTDFGFWKSTVKKEIKVKLSEIMQNDSLVIFKGFS